MSKKWPRWMACYPLYVVDTFHNYNTGARSITVHLFWRLLPIRIPLRRMPEAVRAKGSGRG